MGYSFQILRALLHYCLLATALSSLLHSRPQIKAARLIREAHVIVHDDLGTGDALHLASEDCEKIYVGKRGGRCATGWNVCHWMRPMSL